jgi:hypothetical protein
MDGRVSILRVAKRSHELAHPVQVEIGLGKLGGVFQAIIDKTIQVVKGVVVGGFGVHWERF